MILGSWLVSAAQLYSNFDYKNNKVYFKKNQLFDLPFEYNMSGLEIQHKGSQWVKYEVSALDRKNNEVDKVINFYEKVVDYKYELKPIYLPQIKSSILLLQKSLYPHCSHA